MDFPSAIADLVCASIKSAFGQDIPAAELAGMLEVPPDTNLGDFAFPCFKLAKSLRMAPPAIAAKLADISAPFLEKVDCVGGYLNFFVNREQFAKTVVAAALEDGYGKSDIGAGKTVCLDYSSINIAKRFSIAHLSTTMIGHSLRRIHQHLGYQTVSINHLGDWGTQFGKMVAAYLKWGSKEDVEARGLTAMTELYVRFNTEAKEKPELEEEGRFWFKKIEDGDPQALEIFSWFKDATLKEAMKVYERLGVSFDSYAGESFYNDKMDAVVDLLREKSLLTESDGAYVVDLEDAKMPPCLILKKDGATLYATRDIAAAIYRKNTYNFDKSLYVVAYQQDLHFAQFFKVLEKMGFEWSKDLEHVSFGMISYEGQSLSTRAGHILYLEELLNRAEEKALAIIREKSPELENKEEVARQVGIGSVIFYDLSNNRIRDIDFWWDRALNFEGETGAYVQYAHARCCSLLSKTPADLPAPDWSALAGKEAQDVVKVIADFPSVILDACRRSEPSLITRLTVDLAQAYNRFYYQERILDENAAATAARVALTRATRDTLASALYLIGIEAPQRM